jgi:hypothetical protein
MVVASCNRHCREIAEPGVGEQQLFKQPSCETWNREILTYYGAKDIITNSYVSIVEAEVTE